jgi:hypothetical protein
VLLLFLPILLATQASPFFLLNGGVTRADYVCSGQILNKNEPIALQAGRGVGCHQTTDLYCQ